MKGVVFDIKQLAVFDGPGIRTTVFLKGCPLRCSWCHNPEGLSRKPQVIVKKNQCISCGTCIDLCSHQEKCVLCGACVENCPVHARKICGIEWEAEDLIKKLRKEEAYLKNQGGGITFSGGEPTYQSEFLLEVLKGLKGMHRTIETSGFCEEKRFQSIVDQLDLVIMDIKQMDSEIHKRYTGQDNELILKNLRFLQESGKPFLIRIPLIPGITDTEKNLEETAAALDGSKSLLGVELLPYHQTAGAKYPMTGRIFEPGFAEAQIPRKDTSPFLKRKIPCKVL
jgi:pyruvate formate lyase activating enzyme